MLQEFLVNNNEYLLKYFYMQTPVPGKALKAQSSIPSACSILLYHTIWFYRFDIIVCDTKRAD